VIYNGKVHNLKIIYKRRAENENKSKVETTDRVNRVFSATTHGSLTRIGYNAPDE